MATTLASKITSLLAPPEVSEVHLDVKKQINKYRILQILSSKHKIYYVIPSKSVISIARLLEILFRQKVGYHLDDEVFAEDSNLIVTDDTHLLKMISYEEPYTFAKVVVMDEGLELTEKGEVSYILWHASSKQKFKFLFFSSDHSASSFPVYSIDTASNSIDVIYTETDLKGDALLNQVAEQIILEYAVLSRGCCIIVFIAGIEHQIGIKKRLYQLQMQTVSLLDLGYEGLKVIKKDDRPKIILTDRETDVNALSDISVIIDLMLEERNGRYQYISKHRAQRRAKRINLAAGRCFRMISKKTYEQLHPYHFAEVIQQDYLMLRLLQHGLSPNQIHHYLSIPLERVYERLELYRRMTLINKHNKLLFLGQQHLDMNVKAEVFNFINRWYKDEHSLFPAVVVAGLLEHGRPDYFQIDRSKNHHEIKRDVNRYQYYIEEDDLATYLKLYSDLMEDFRGLPDLTREKDVQFLMKWTEERQLDYEPIRKITNNINRLLQQLDQRKYSLSLGSFNQKKVLALSKRYTRYTHTVVNRDKNSKYYDDRGNEYLFGDYHLNTLRQDLPASIIVLEYETAENNPKKRYIKLAINNHASSKPKVPDVEPYSIDSIEKNIEIGLEVFSNLTLEDYIINPTPTKLKNAQLMAPKYQQWFSPTQPIFETVFINDEVYTKAENEQIKTNVGYKGVLTERGLPHRDISDVFDITLNWPERGYHLIEKEFLISYGDERVVYVGPLRADFNILLDLYPEMEFIVAASNAPLREHVINVGDIDLLDHSQYEGALLISHERDIQKNLDLITKLKPQVALVPFELKSDLKYYRGELVTVPFQPKGSHLTYLRTDAKEMVDYKYQDYLDRIFYHNLIIRQWHQFDHAIINKKDNKTAPNRQDEAVDKCYDCSREVHIHEEFLKKYNKNFNTQMIRDEINNLSTFLSGIRSLYKPPHGVLPNYEIAIRRLNLRNLKYKEVPQRPRGRRLRY